MKPLRRWMSGWARGARDSMLKRCPRLTGFAVRTMAKLVPFHEWERHGFHLTPVHFYSPIPDTASLPESLWHRRSDLVGLDTRPSEQVALLERLVAAYGGELRRLPVEPVPGRDTFALHNDNFESLDAQVAYALVRDLKPRRIVEVGSGWSTLLLLDALAANAAEGAAGSLLCCEPYPRPFLTRTLERRPDVQLLQLPVQDVPLERFTELGDGDVLFIDSSHVVRVGGDVVHEYLEILPRLAPGVVVHVHDVFLPAEYPRDWVMRRRWFWSEQYLVQAFLAFNRAFEVLWASHLMTLQHGDVLSRLLTPYEPERGNGSLWLRRSPERPVTGH